MRRFKIKNNIGAELDLTSKEIFFNNPSGLGYSFQNEYIKNGSNYAKTNEIQSQIIVEGDIVFESYAKKQEFNNIIARSPLVLEYTDGLQTKYLQCEITNFDLTEISSNSQRLEVPIAFTGLSDWYTSITTSQTQTEKGKSYPYKYPFKYTSATQGILPLENNTNKIAVVKLSFEGLAINPKWELFDNNTSVISGKINYTIPEQQKLVIDSNEGQEEIAIYDLKNNYIKSVYQYSDWSTSRFIYLQPFTSYELSISHEGANQIKGFAEVTNREI